MKGDKKLKNTSNIMYKIAKILNIIALPLLVIVMIAGTFLLVYGGLSLAAGTIENSSSATASSSISFSDKLDEETAAVFLLNGIYMLVLGFVLIVFEIVTLVVCTKKHNLIKAGNTEPSPRVFLIVFGALSENIFYILAGIFSLIARAQEANGNTVVENKTETTAEKEVVEGEVVKDEPKKVDAE